jgi:hypothetical protein
MSAEFGEPERPVDRCHRAFVGVQLTVGPTSRARGPCGLLRHHRLHLPLLNHAAELTPQLMGPQLDDRIVRDPLNRPVGSIEGDRDLRSFSEQTREFFLQFVDMPFHGDPLNPGPGVPPNHQVSRTLPQILGFLY